MNDQPNERPREDRILEIAQHGRADLAETLDDLTQKHGNSEQTLNWLHAELQQARAAFRDGDSGGSIGRLAAAAEAFLWWDLPAMTGLLCGLAVTYEVELVKNAHAVAPIDRANLRNVTGLLAFMLGRFDTAYTLFTGARALAAEAQDPQMQASAVLNLCNIARIRNDKPAARQLADAALGLYEAAGDTRGRLKLQLTLADMAIEDSDLAAAADWLETLGGITKLGQPSLTASYHHARGRYLALERRWNDAETAMQASLRAARRARHSDHELSTLQSLAALANEAGKPALARRRTRAAVNVARTRGLPHRLAQLLPSYISGELSVGNVGEARSAAEELLELARGSRIDLANAYFLLGAVQLEQGQTEAALESFDTAQAELPLNGLNLQPDNELAADIFHNAVIAHARYGTIVDHAEELASTARNVPGSADALKHLGLALAQEEQWEESARLLLESLALQPPHERAWFGLVAAAQLGGYDSAGARTALLRSAVGIAEEHGQKTVAMRARNDLALARIDDNDLEEGLALLNENLDAAQSADDSIIRQQAIYNLAETRRRLDDLDGAQRDAAVALKLAETLHDDALLASSWVQMGQVLTQQGDLNKARAFYEQAVQATASHDQAYASALSGLAGIALAEDDPATAAELYAECLRLDARSPVQRLENLIYLSEALAAQGRRRQYARRLQQVVDSASGTPFNLHMATGMARIAQRWSAAGKPRYAGEVLAVGILTWALETQRRNEDLSDETLSPFYTVLSASAWELLREADAGEPADRTRAALEGELRRHLKSAQAVKTMMSLVNSALEAFEERNA